MIAKIYLFLFYNELKIILILFNCFLIRRKKCLSPKNFLESVFVKNLQIQINNNILIMLKLKYLYLLNYRVNINNPPVIISLFPNHNLINYLNINS